MINSLLKKTFNIPFFLFLSLVAFSNAAQADSASVIDIKVNEALNKFYTEVKSAKKLVKKARGVLVFPSVIKAGFGIGGEYGEGALRIKGKTVDYYSTAAASIGFQLGAQSKAIILLFMEQKALSDFRKSEAWEIGVDGSIVLVKVGVGGSLDTTTLNQPIIGFVFTNKGLMYNLTLEGSKMTKLKK